MRWVLLTDDHPPQVGGVAAFVGRVGRELVDRGHQVQVFARRPRYGALKPIAGACLTPVRGPRFGRFAGRWLGLAALGALRRADAVIATTWVCGTLAARLPVPLHVVAHGSDVTRPPVRPGAFTRVWRAARGRFALSAFLAAQLARRGVVARVLPAPVPQPIVAAGPRAATGRWGMVARATPWKGGERFIRLVAQAGVEGVVVGDGACRPAWERVAAAIGARVRFVGPQPPHEVAALMQTWDLICLLPRARPDGSGAEGLGLVLLEAAALGVPAVGCDVGGVVEAVGPGLVLDDPDDAPRSAQAIAQWWTPRRGSVAQAWCRDHHGVGRLVDQLEAAT